MAPKKFTGEAPAAAPADTTVRRMRYPCAAHQCPMPGTMFIEGSPNGVCGFHGREPAHDWPTITQAILDWACVRIAIERGQRVLIDPLTCNDGKTQAATLKAEWEAMLPAVQGSGWKARLEPQARESLGDWVVRLRNFLAARVKERQQGSTGVVDETKPTAFAAEVKAGLKDAPKGNAADQWGDA